MDTLRLVPLMWTHAQASIAANPWLSLLIAGASLWGLVCLFLFWLRPLAAMRLNEALAPLDWKLPSSAGGMTVSARYVLFIGFLGYRPRVLDAWVKSTIEIARERFAKKATVEARQIHVSLPVSVDNKTFAELTVGDLRATFRRHLACLLIHGEGGSGKTSLACQVARWGMADDREQRLTDHLMLPVLIEQELDFTGPKDKDPLFEAIRRQLQDLTDVPEPVPPSRLEALLRHRRVLVIVDHLSEMSEVTRSKIQPKSSDFPANALVVTSRLKVSLGEIAKTVLEPFRVDSDRLAVFMDAYLKQRGKRALFDDTEFFAICKSLSSMVGARKITVLLAKLYAEQQIAAKEGAQEDELPRNIPYLMLTYINQLNRSVVEGRIDNNILHKDAQMIAWKCLERSYVPRAINREAAIAALGGSNGAEQRLRYFEERLFLIRRVEPADVRFLLDPLAEYLAGLHLVASCGNSTTAWQDVLSYADRLPGAPAAIVGFLLALRDCCIARGKEAEIPQFVKSELARRAGLDMEAVWQASRKRRLAGLLRGLKSPDVLERRDAANALADNMKDVVSEALGSLGEQHDNVIISLTAALKAGDYISPGSLPRPAIFRFILELGRQVISEVSKADLDAFGESLCEFVKGLRTDDPVPYYEELGYALERLPELRRQLYGSVPKHNPELIAAFGEMAIDDLISLIENSNVKQGLREVVLPLCSIRPIGRECAAHLPRLMILAGRKINEWAGDRDYPGQYEDQIKGYLYSLASAIQHIAAEAFPERSDEIKAFEPRVTFEDDPEHTWGNENRYYIGNFSKLEGLITDLLPKNQIAHQ